MQDGPMQELDEHQRRIMDIALQLDAKFKEERRQKFNEKNRRYRELHPDRVAKTQAKYRASRPGRGKEYYNNNRDRMLFLNKQNREKNLEEYRLKGRAKNKGITSDEVARILSVQPTCEICGFEFKDGSRTTTGHIDHSHEDMSIRGVLCAMCNRGLGHFRDDPVRLQAAIDYLERSRPIRLHDWSPGLSNLVPLGQTQCPSCTAVSGDRA